MAWKALLQQLIKALLKMNVIKILLCLGCLFGNFGCMKGNDIVRQGALSYDVADIFGKTSTLGLARAAAAGNLAEIKKQLAEGTDPNIIGKHDITPIWWAAWTQNLKGFTALLEAGANPNLCRREGLSLMILITRMKDPRYLEEALNHGGDPNFRDVNPIKTPIFEAVMYSDALRQRELLLSAGANLNAQDGNGETPIMRAIEARGDYKLVWEFLQRGASYNIETSYKKTLADMIGIRLINPASDQYSWREKVIEFLRSKGVEAHRPINEG